MATPHEVLEAELKMHIRRLEAAMTTCAAVASGTSGVIVDTTTNVPECPVEAVLLATPHVSALIDESASAPKKEGCLTPQDVFKPPLEMLVQWLRAGGHEAARCSLTTRSELWSIMMQILPALVNGYQFHSPALELFCDVIVCWVLCENSYCPAGAHLVDLDNDAYFALFSDPLRKALEARVVEYNKLNEVERVRLLSNAGRGASLVLAPFYRYLGNMNFAFCLLDSILVYASDFEHTWLERGD